MKILEMEQWVFLLLQIQVLGPMEHILDLVMKWQMTQILKDHLEN